MSTISERLQSVCDRYFEGNISQMAKAYGLAQNYLYYSVKRNGNPNFTALSAIASDTRYPVNSHWLLTGMGDMVDGERADDSSLMGVISNLQQDCAAKQKTIDALLAKYVLNDSIVASVNE